MYTLSILNNEVTMTAHSSYNGRTSTLCCSLCKSLYVSTQLQVNCQAHIIQAKAPPCIYHEEATYKSLALTTG